MNTYLSQPNDNFADLAKKFGVKDEHFFRLFHNLNCPEGEIIKDEIPVGTSILIPDDPQFLAEVPTEDSVWDEEEPDFGVDSMSEEQEPSVGEAHHEATSQHQKNDQNKVTNDASSPHEGKYFIIPRGQVQCNQGFLFPHPKVTSHQKHYWNDANGQADCLAVTEDDVQLNPSAQPFGQCKLKPSSGGYLPCAFAAAGKWTQAYDKVKVMGKSCLTEISELMCSTGGKITILKHGQQSEIGKNHVKKANSREQQIYNPIINFDEFKEQISGDDFFEVE